MSVNPAAFSEGRDLVRPDSVLWKVAFPTISKSRPILREHLLRDGLVPETDLNQSIAIFPSRRTGRPSTLLYHFNQPFPARFDGTQYIHVVIGDQKYRSDSRVFPTSGKALPPPFIPTPAALWCASNSPLFQSTLQTRVACSAS